MKNQDIALKPYQLPVSHPEYRFQASKNPYFKKIQNHPTLVSWDHQAEEKKGKWISFVQSQSTHPLHRLHLEIGCSTGHVMRGRAVENLNTAYVGLEWKFKIVFQGAEKAIKAGLKNAHFIRSHAERLEYLFAESELDQISVYFSDPWPKPSQHKNRIVQAAFFERALKVLKSDGILDIRTDHREYFEFILEEFKPFEKSFEVVELTHNKHENHPNPESLQIPEVTLFERIFIKEKKPIHYLSLRKV